METICTSRAEDVQPLVAELTKAYQEAFEGKPWYEVRKCPRPELPERSRCVGNFSSQAIGELCVDCRLRPTEPAYADAECETMFTDLLASGAAFYIERDDRGVLMATIGVKETARELAEGKYADNPAMLPWLVSTLGGEDAETTYLTESFASLNKRPRGNMANRRDSVRSIVAETGQNLVTARTISPAVIAATLRDFPDVQLYVPNGEYRSAWNAELDNFASSAAGEVPDRRAFLVWEAAR